MAELRGTKSRLLVAEIRRLGGGPLTHEELYQQSAAIQKEFPDSIAVSRRLSDLFKSGTLLGRVSKKQDGGRKQFAYHYVAPEQLSSPTETQTASPTKPAENSTSTLRKARAAMGLSPETKTEEGIVPAFLRTKPASATATSTPTPAALPASATTTRPQSIPESPVPEASRPQPKPQPETTAPGAAESASDPLAHLLTGLFSDLLSQLIDEVAPSLRKALLTAPQTAQVRAALQRAVRPDDYVSEEEEGEAEIEASSAAATAEGKEKPALRVLIVGLLGQQAENLKHAYRERIRFQFWNEDRANDQLKQLISGSEVVIGATKFISHAVDGVLSRADRYVRVHGGVSKIRLELSKLLKEQRLAD